MLTLEPCKHIDVEGLQPWCRQHAESAADSADLLVKRSELALQIADKAGPVAAGGVIRSTLVGRPYLWYVAWERFTIYHMIEVQQTVIKLIDKHYPSGLSGLVRPDNDFGIKLAKAFGFKPIGSYGGYTVVERYNGRS